MGTFGKILSLLVVLYMVNTVVRFPVSKTTIKVVDEDGKPVDEAMVGIGRIPSPAGADTASRGMTGSDGVYSGIGPSIDTVAFRVNKKGYYESAGGFRFTSRSMGIWRPWDPEIKVTLRKIVNPVPLYARDTFMSKMVLPVAGKPVGFDLIAFDWLPPYGKGAHSDFIFRLTRDYVDDKNFRCHLDLTFSNPNDGIQRAGRKDPYSMFRLNRTAPIEGYLGSLEHTVTDTSNDFDKKANYFFRVRSKVVNGRVQGMYGKIHGDVTFNPIGHKTASVSFEYFLNPHLSNNLEFDFDRNLFSKIQSYERGVGP